MLAIKNFPKAISQKREWQLAATLVVLLIALVLRLWNLGAESAWIDEAYSIALANHPIAQIIQGTASDQHPPLYYLLLHFWLLFGSGVTYSRLLSVVIGMIGVGQIMQFGKRLAGEVVGLGAGLLLAISPIHVWYSQEIRMYILLAVLTTAASMELWSCLEDRGRWWLYWLYAIMAIYTHYFAAFILFAHAALVIAWTLWHRDRSVLIKWGLAMLALGLGFLPWLPTAINQTRFHTMSWVAVPKSIQIAETLLRLLFGSVVLVLPPLLLWLGVSVLVILLVVSFRWVRRQGLEGFWPYLFITGWAFIPFAAITFIGLFYPIFQFKQFLIIVAPLLVWAVWLSKSMPSRLGSLFLAALFVSSSVSLVYQQVTLTKDDWRGASSYIQENFSSGDMVYANPAASSLAFSLYWDKPLPFKGYPPNYDIVSGGWDGIVLTSRIAEQELEAAAQGHSRIWLVELFPQLWDPDQTLPGWLSQHGQLLEDKNFGTIHLRLYQLTNNR